MIVNETREPAFWSRSSFIQLGYGLWVSLTMIGVGLVFNFPAITIPQLKEETAAFQVTLDDEAWIASVITLASPFGCIICGYLMDKLGRKIILVLCELPMCAGWIYIGVATSAKHMIIGRLITGLGMGMSIGAPRIYITEVSLPNMRGLVGALPNLFLSLGVTLLGAVGIFLEWTTICFLAAGYNLALAVFNTVLPETPYFVLMRSNEDIALNSLKKFRAASYNTDKEIADMLEYKTENNIRRLTCVGQLKLLLTKAAWKPFFIVFMYMLFSQLAGTTIIFTWTIEILKVSRSTVDPHVGNFMLGITRFLTAILSSFLLYRIGRKPQALISGVGVGLSSIFLGSYLNYTSKPNVVPQIAYVSYVMFASIGYYTLPLLIMYELYPLQIRGLLGGISTSFLHLFIFGSNKCYPYLRNLIGHANVLLCFGTSSLIGCVFLFFYLPETKGLTLQEIEEYFNERRPTLVSQKSVRALQMSGSRMDRKSIDSPQLSRKHIDPVQLQKKEGESSPQIIDPSPSKDGEDKLKMG